MWLCTVSEDAGGVWFVQRWPKLKPIHDSNRLNPAEGARSMWSRCPCHSKTHTEVNIYKCADAFGLHVREWRLICCVCVMVWDWAMCEWCKQKARCGLKAAVRFTAKCHHLVNIYFCAGIFSFSQNKMYLLFLLWMTPVCLRKSCFHNANWAIEMEWTEVQIKYKKKL